MQKAAVIIACLIVLGIAGFTPEAAASSESKDMAEAPRPLDSRERQRVKKLATDLGNSMQTLNQGGILPFQDPAYAEKWRKLVGRYRAIVTKYPQSEDPDVLVAVTKLAELKNMVAFGVSQAGKQTNDASDAWTIIKVVQTILAKIENDLQTHRAPQWLTTPFTEMEAREWRQVAANARETAHDAISELQRIAPDGHLAVNLSTAQSGALNNKKDLDRLLLFAIDSLQEVDAAFKHTFNTLQSRFYIQNEELDYYRKRDPEIEKHRINAFSNDGAAVEIYAGLDRHLALAQSLNAFSNAYDKRPNPRWKARIDEIIALRKTYSENRLKVLEQVPSVLNRKHAIRDSHI